MDLDDKYFHLNKLNKKTGHKHYKTYKSMELKLSNLNLLPYFFIKIITVKSQPNLHCINIQKIKNKTTYNNCKKLWRPRKIQNGASKIYNANKCF